jgi:hypothetical protein
MNVDLFTAAYIEAIYFTETGDADQPSADDDLAPLSKARAWIECRNFWWAYGHLVRAAGASASQAGHDLWLTRNGHGVGFWDRPEVYGQALSEELTRAAQAMGSVDPDFIHQSDTLEAA